MKCHATCSIRLSALLSILVLAGALTVTAQVPIGYLDGATCSYAGGWAKAPDSDNPISVHLWFDGSSSWVRGTTANLYRADVGYHAFHFGYDEALLQMVCDGGQHQVAAYGIWGSNPQLGSSPRTISCGYFVTTDGRFSCCPSPDMVIDTSGSCVLPAFHKTFDRYTGSTTIVNLDLDVEADCAADNMCVDKDSSCVAQWTAGSLSSADVDDRIAYCGGGSNPDAWIDCDYSEARCGTCGSVSSTGWMEAGEAGVGEYGTGDGGDGVTECCGDDSDEYITSGNGMTACCSSPASVLDASGSCVPRPDPLGSEILGRGLICLPEANGVYCGWRLLRWDDATAGFNLYRSSSAQGPFTLVNSTPVTGSTNYLDTTAVSGSTYYYRVAAVESGLEGSQSEPSKVTHGAARSYVELGLTLNDTISKVMTGDLNADGVLDFVAVTPFSIGNECTGQPFWLEALISGNGTWSSEWTKNTGFVPSGSCHHPTVMPAAVWDLDGDLQAEVIARFSGDGNQLAVLDGTKGIVRALAPWPYQDGSADRNLMAIAYLADVTGDGVPDPHITIQRGLYAGTQRFVAYYLDASTDTLIKSRDVLFNDGTSRGTHGLPVADVDNDGKDEIVACGTVLDDDLSVLYSGNLCHNDACFPADIRPDLPGLEVFMGEEGCNRKAHLFSSTGLTVWTTNADPYYRGGWERGWCSDLTAAYAGMECFAYEIIEGDPDHWYAHIFAADGTDITTSFMSESERSTNVGSTRWPMDWSSGDGIKELYTFCNAPGVTGCGWYSGWPGDILGDAREEAIVFAGTGFFRVYTNTAVNGSRSLTRLDDRGYRAAISRVGVGYNTNFIPERSNQARADVVEPGS